MEHSLVETEKEKDGGAMKRIFIKPSLYLLYVLISIPVYLLVYTYAKELSGPIWFVILTVGVGVGFKMSGIEEEMMT